MRIKGRDHLKFIAIPEISSYVPDLLPTVVLDLTITLAPVCHQHFYGLLMTLLVHTA
uniref:Uncharacterized protein n=1 Tax=Arion vulgaris TaxID=1028688 RepID=A0A0B6ZLU5_9EUPU